MCIRDRANSGLKRETWIENTGGNPCYIRIKVCIPQAEGVDILELGTLVNDFFLPLDFSENTGRNKTGEYWTKEGEYLYYRKDVYKRQSLISLLKMMERIRCMAVPAVTTRCFGMWIRCRMGTSPLLFSLM